MTLACVGYAWNIEQTLLLRGEFVSIRKPAFVMLGVAMVAAAPLRAQAPIRAADAKPYVGKQVVVVDSVAQVTVSRRSNTVFVNFGGRYPNQVFNAVIFSSSTHRFPNASSWQGKWLRVTGRIQLYQGKPEIILRDPEQAKVVSGP